MKKTSKAQPILWSIHEFICSPLNISGSNSPKKLSRVLTRYENANMPEVINKFLAGISLFYANLLSTVYSPDHATSITTNVTK